MSTHPTSHDKHETVVQKEQKKLIVAGWMLVAVGLLDILVFIAEKTKVVDLPSSFGIVRTISTIAFFVALGIILLQGSRRKMRELSPKDEFEASENQIAKAKAFNFLNTGVLIAVIFASGSVEIMSGLLVMIMGYSWVILAQNNGRMDA